jgi:hypothetical protein
MARIGTLTALVVVALAALAASASAASPDVQAMNLQAADVPGAKVAKQHSVKEKGYVAAHSRSFVFSGANSGHLVVLESETALASSATTPTKDVAGLEKPFHSPAARKAIIASLAQGARVKAKLVTLGRPRKVAGFDQGFEVAVSTPFKGRRIYENFVFLRLDRVLVLMDEVGVRPISAAVTGRYAALIAGHIGTELSPIDVSPPTATGTAQQGQTLTAAPGTWTAADAAFTYQWQHCDGAGANCVDVPGATAQTYAVTPADVGTTLHVVVKATNRFGSATAPSGATAVVT